MNWLEEQERERALLKEAIWGDQDFLDWVASRGHDESYRAVCEFKWEVTDQIKARREAGTSYPEWEKKVMPLVIRLNQRKSQLMRHIRAVKGDQYFADLREEIRDDNRD